MKKLLTSIIACSLIIVSIAGCSSNEKKDDDTAAIEFKTYVLEENDNGNEKINEGSNLIEIDEEETPKATITKSGKNAKVKNLTNSQITTIRNNLIDSVNKERKKNSKKTVSKNTTLQKTGNIRAKETVKKWSHTRPNKKKWTTVLTANGISNKKLKAGENLAKISTKAKASYSASFIKQLSQALHASLMASKTHKSVILDKNYKTAGIGVYSEIKNGTLTVYVTEHFKN